MTELPDEMEPTVAIRMEFYDNKVEYGRFWGCAADQIAVAHEAPTEAATQETAENMTSFRPVIENQNVHGPHREAPL